MASPSDSVYPIRPFQQISDRSNLAALIISPKINFKKQNKVINSVSAAVYQQAIRDKKKTQSESYNEMYDFINQNSRNKLQSLRYQNPEAVDIALGEIDKIIANWSRVKKIVNHRLKTIGGIDTGIDDPILQPTTEERARTQEESQDEEDYQQYDDNARYLTDPRDRLAHHKKVFAFAENRKKDKPEVAQKAYLALTDYLTFDEAYNRALKVLVGIKPDYDTMIRKLRDYEDAYPFFRSVIENLEASPQATKNAIVSHFSSLRKLDQLDVRYTMDNTGAMRYQIYATNQNEKGKAVRRQWEIGIENSALTYKDKNDYSITRVDTAVASRLREEMKKMLADIDNLTTDKAKAWLDQLGIELSPQTWKVLYRDGMSRNMTQYNWYSIFTTRGGFFYELQQRLGEYLNPNKTDIIDDLPLTDHSAFSVVSEIEARFNPSAFSHTVHTGNKQLFSYAPSDYMHDRLEKLKSDRHLLWELSQSPFSQHGKWNKNLLATFGEDGKRKPNLFAQVFDIKEVSLDPYQHERKNQRPREYRDLTSAEKEGWHLAMYANLGSKAKDGNDYRRIGRIATPTLGDRKSPKLITQTLTNVTFDNKNEAGQRLSNETIDELYDQLVRPDIDRILQTQDANLTIDGYDKGSALFFFIPSLNNLESLFDGTKLRTDIHSDEALIQEIKDEVRRHVDALIEKRSKDWETLGVFKEGLMDTRHLEYLLSGTGNKTKLSQLTDQQKEQVVADYEVNTLISNANYFMSFAGDPALYYKAKKPVNKTDEVRQSSENILKRLPGEDAPGTTRADAEKESIRVGMMTDKTASSYAKTYYDILSDEQKAKFQQEGLKGGDAGELVLLAEYITQMHKEGLMSDEQYDQIKRKIDSHEGGDTYNLTNDQITLLLNPQKPRYNNNFYDAENKTDRKVYIKMASFPLIPELTANSSLDHLRRAMERQGIDRVAPKSAVKVGFTNNSLDIWDKDGNVKPDLEFGDDQILTLPREGLKIQQPNPVKKQNRTTLGVQESKMFMTNLLEVDTFTYKGAYGYTGKQLKEMLEESMGIQYRNDYETLRDELEDGNGNVDIKKLKRILRDEAEDKKFGLTDLDAIQTVGNNFKVPIWSLANRKRYEALLNSIVSNRVMKRKMSGSSSIMISQEGYDINEELTYIGKDGQKRVKKNNSKMSLKPDWDGTLKPKRTVIVDQDGNTQYNEQGEELLADADTPFSQKKVMPEQIIIGFKFTDNNGKRLKLSDFTDSKGFVDLSKFDEELLNMFGFRIPTGGLSFTTNAEVVGFLPENAADAVISSRDLTGKMGLDYDNDKFITYQYNTIYDQRTGSLSRMPEADSDDELSDLVRTIKMMDTRMTEENIEVTDIELRKYRNYLEENKGIDLRIAAQLNPENRVQREFIRPEGTYELRKRADEIKESMRESTEGEFSFLSSLYQRKQYEDIQSSASGVRVKSNDIVFNSIIQGLDLTIIKDGEPMVINFANKQSNGDLSSPYLLDDTDGTAVKSNVHYVYQTIHLDHVSEQIAQWINSVTETFNAERAMAHLGFSENDIVALMSQPIIREYVKQVHKAKTASERNFGKVQQLAFNETIQQERFRDELFGAEDEQSPAYTDKIRAELAKMDSKALMKMVLDDDPLVGNFAGFQNSLIEKFFNFKLIGSKIQDVQQMTNIDSKKIPSDQVKSQAKQRQVCELATTNYRGIDIQNKGKVLGETSFEKESAEHAFVGKNIKNIPIYMKSTTIPGHATISGLLPNNQWFSKLFPYNTPMMDDITDEIKRLEHSKNELIMRRAESDRHIFDDMMRYLFTKASTGLFKTDDNGNVINLAAQRERLVKDFDDSTSLGNKIEKIYKDEETGKMSSFKHNPFLKLLKTKLNKRSGLRKVLYMDGGGAQRIDDTDIYAGFMELHDNNEYITEFDGASYYTRDLFRDLVRHQFLTGSSKGANSFMHYIPIPYLDQIGFGNFLNQLDFESDYAIFDTQSSPKEHYWEKSRFARQHVQHNPNKQIRVKDRHIETQGFISGRDQEFKLKADSETKKDLFVTGRHDNRVSKRDSVPPEYLSYQAERGIRLYEYVGAGTYVEIDLLGDSSTTEFNANVPYETSIFPKNRSLTDEPSDFEVRKD